VFIIKISKYLLRFICVSVVTLIHKKKSIWVFGAWFGKSYSDNPKYIYQYVRSLNTSEVTPIWIAKEAKLVRELKGKGINAFKHNSFFGIYYQIISKVVFVGHSVSSDLNPWCIGFNTRRVQLWHGIPLKKIGFDDCVFTNKNFKFKKYQFFLSLLTNDNYDLVTSTGTVCTKLFSSAFNVPVNKIVATGFPRNDVFYGDVNQRDNKASYKVIYMPTFRGSVGDDFDLFERFGFDVDVFDGFFEKNDIDFIIRTHPANKPSDNIVQKIKKSKKIHMSTVSDIYEEIAGYDCLITDYSSIMFDFSLLNKPILFSPFDLDSYLKNDRELYFDYDDVSGGEYYLDWSSLLVAILTVKHSRKKFSSSYLKGFNDELICNRNQYSKNVFECVRKKF